MTAKSPRTVTYANFSNVKCHILKNLEKLVKKFTKSVAAAKLLCYQRILTGSASYRQEELTNR